MIKYHPKKINILVAMARKGFNQKVLSEHSDLDPSTLSTFLNGKRVLSPTSAKKLAFALDAEIEDLFEIQINQKEVKANGECFFGESAAANEGRNCGVGYKNSKCTNSGEKQ